MKSRYLGVALGTVFFAFPGSVQADSATLKVLKGSVYVQDVGKNVWEPVKDSRSVDEGVQIKTHNDSRAFLVLSDDHKVAIGPDTHFSVQRMRSGETKFFLKAGALRNKVRPLQPALGQYYKIQTPTAVCAVRGTDFLTTFAQEQTRVTTFEGSVAFGRKEAEALLVNAGESAMANMREAQMAPNSQPAEKKENTDGAKSDEKKPDDRKGPPPPGGPGTPGVPVAPLPPPNNLDWNHPEKWDSGTQDPFRDPGEPGDVKPPNETQAGRPVNPPPVPPQQPGPYTSFNPLTGTGFENTTGLLPPPPPGVMDPSLPTVPPAGTGSPTGPNPTEVGIDALVSTLNAQALYDQAQAIQVADLFKLDAVKFDPATGQLRQFADAVLKVGNDSIKFVNANMLPGQPATLNYATALTRFNAPLPANYIDATKSAFSAGATPPSYYATSYHSDMSNTVDHVLVDATGGSLITDTNGNYLTEFSNMSARIVNPNGNFLLWNKSGTVTTYRGGARPVETFVNLGAGRADTEVRNNYANGDFFAVRNTISDGNSTGPASLANVPTTMTAGQFLDDLFIRTTLVSNLFMRGPITVFGSMKARHLSGMYSFSNSEAQSILSGGSSPKGAPLGLIPS